MGQKRFQIVLTSTLHFRVCEQSLGIKLAYIEMIRVEEQTVALVVLYPTNIHTASATWHASSTTTMG